jgi:O-antigen ligase
MGLGESGRMSAFEGLNTGGENQFIIIGVQLGLVGLGLYLAAYILTIKHAIKTIKTQTGKIRRLALFVLLVKIGLFIPLFTAEVESYIYISYTTWFLTGLFFNMKAQTIKKINLR